jgi:hypothetical protein
MNVAYELKLYGSSFTGLTIKGDGDLDYSISLPEIDMEDEIILKYISRGIKGDNQFRSEIVSFSMPRL